MRLSDVALCPAPAAYFYTWNMRQITRSSPCSPVSCQEPAWPRPARPGTKLGLCDQYCQDGGQVVISSVWEDVTNKQLRRSCQPDTTPDGDSPTGTRFLDSHTEKYLYTRTPLQVPPPGGRGRPLLSIVVVTRWPCCLEWSRAAQSIDGHRRMYGVLF